MLKGVVITLLVACMLGLLYLLFVADPGDRKKVVESVGSTVKKGAGKLQSAADRAADAANSIHEDPAAEAGDGPPPEPQPPKESIEAQGLIQRIKKTRSDGVRTNDERRVVQLRLFNMDITDTDMKAIGDMDQVKVLLLNGTKISDRGMLHLVNLERLEELDVSSTKVTGRGMLPLRGHKNLKRLSMAFNNVQDAGAAVLARLPALEYLKLSETKVGDRGVIALRHLKHLKTLELYNAPVTEKTLEQFERARPELTIKR
ncbi:MAG: hypothetical protein R3236_03555 [Phycisphaeraceae bacterium]|nr:hypothetical protein [Phycisphaeraceae bacterium]